MSDRAALDRRQHHNRRVQLAAAAVMLILCILTARDLKLAGLTLSKEILITAAAAVTLLCCLFNANLRRLRLSEAAAMGAAPPACFILLSGASLVPVTFLLCFALCMICYFSLRLLFRMACGREQSLSLKRRCHRIAREWTLPVIGMAVILLAISSAFSTVGGEVLLEREPPLDREALFEAYEEELSVLDPISWLGYDEDERLGALAVVAELECAWLGIDPPKLASAELGEDVLGQYDNKKRTVFISDEELRSRSAFTCISTLLHELRHVYQFRVVESVDWSNKGSELRLYQEAAVWRDELMGYVSGTHDAYEAYYEQAIEADARAYAGEFSLDYVEILS